MGGEKRSGCSTVVVVVVGALILNAAWPSDPRLNAAPADDVPTSRDDADDAALLPYLAVDALREEEPDPYGFCDLERPFVPVPDRRLYATWQRFPLNEAEHGINGTLRVLQDSRFTSAGAHRNGTNPVLPPCDQLSGRLEVVDRSGRVVDAIEIGSQADIFPYRVAEHQTLFERRDLVHCVASCWCGNYRDFLQVVQGRIKSLATTSNTGKVTEVRGVTNGCYEGGGVVRGDDDRFEVHVLRTRGADFSVTWERHFWDGAAWRSGVLPTKDRW